MNQYRKKILSFVCLSSLFLHNSQSRADSWDDFGVGLIIAGATAAIVGTTVWAISQESNSALLIRAKEAYHNAKKHKQLFNTIKNYDHSSNTLTEPELEDLALFLMKSDSIDKNIQRVERSIDSLLEVNNALCQRITKIQNSIERQEIAFCANMQTLSYKITYRINSLKEIKKVLDYYKDYFKLFEYERALHERYYNEFQAVTLYGKGCGLEYAIETAAYHQKQHARYPYSAYISMVNDDQKTMTRLYHTVSSHYCQRKQSALWVIQALSHVADIINSGYKLREEFLQKKRDEIELERQKIELQQQRYQQALKAERKQLKRERKRMENCQ